MYEHVITNDTPISRIIAHYMDEVRVIIDASCFSDMIDGSALNTYTTISYNTRFNTTQKWLSITYQGNYVAGFGCTNDW